MEKQEDFTTETWNFEIERHCAFYGLPSNDRRQKPNLLFPKCHLIKSYIPSFQLEYFPSIIVNQKLFSFSLDQAVRAKVEVAEAKVVDKAKDDSEGGEGEKKRDGETVKVKVKGGELERMKVKDAEVEMVKAKEGDAMKVKEGEVERSSGHRVTFNDQNEVASQDRDGTFKVREGSTHFELRLPAKVQLSSMRGWGVSAKHWACCNFTGRAIKLWTFFHAAQATVLQQSL